MIVGPALLAAVVTVQPGCRLPGREGPVIPIPMGREASVPASRSAPPRATALRPVIDVPLPGRPVRFDYQSEDLATGRLYLSHMDDASVLVFDTRANRVVGRIGGMPRVTGVWVVPELRRLYASVTGRHQVFVIDPDSLTVRSRLGPIGFPDGIAYAPTERRVFVSDESGGGELVIDAPQDQVVGTIPLGGEAGNTKYDDRSGCILVAVQTANQIVAIDPASAKVIRRYRPARADHPHGMYVDSADRLLFVANEGNATLEVIDLATMQVTGLHRVGDGPDVLAFDPEWRRLYVATEGGGLWIYRVPDRSLIVDGVLDLPHAHTVSVDPQTHRVYLPLENVDGKPILRIFDAAR